MKTKIYVESSVVSYLCAKPTRDLIATAHGQITREWWEHAQNRFDLFVSTLVIIEISRGDSAAAGERLKIANALSTLEIFQEVTELAKIILAESGLPKKAGDDATHMAIAAAHGMDFLLTWNCKHIANAFIRKKVEALVQKEGYECPVICTPEELMGEIYGTK